MSTSTGFAVVVTVVVGNVLLLGAADTVGVVVVLLQLIALLFLLHLPFVWLAGAAF